MENGRTTEPRSTFVTAIGWIFVVFAGFGTLIATMQNLMLHLVFPLERMQHEAMRPEMQEQMPGMAKFMFAHFEWFFGAALVVMVVTLIASIGLLRRWNWARLFFIGLMVLGIVWNIGGVVFQQLFIADMATPAEAPDEFHRHFEVMQNVMLVVSVIFAVVFSALFGWIAWMLTRPRIVAEFRSTAGDSAATAD